MVDVLWQRGQQEAAIRLEEYWNELGKLQTFSLFCANRLEPLQLETNGGALQSVCKVHTHLFPLLWLHQNMPRTVAKLLKELRAEASPAA